MGLHKRELLSARDNWELLCRVIIPGYWNATTSALLLGPSPVCLVGCDPSTSVHRFAESCALTSAGRRIRSSMGSRVSRREQRVPLWQFRAGLKPSGLERSLRPGRTEGWLCGLV